MSAYYDYIDDKNHAADFLTSPYECNFEDTSFFGMPVPQQQYQTTSYYHQSLLSQQQQQQQQSHVSQDESSIFATTKPSTINYYSYFHQAAKKQFEMPASSSSSNKLNNNNYSSVSHLTNYSSNFSTSSSQQQQQSHLSSHFQCPSVSSHSTQFPQSSHHLINQQQQSDFNSPMSSSNSNTNISEQSPAWLNQQSLYTTSSVEATAAYMNNSFYFQAKNEMPFSSCSTDFSQPDSNSSIGEINSHELPLQHSLSSSSQQQQQQQINQQSLSTLTDDNCAADASPTSFWDEAVSSKLVFPKNEETTTSHMPQHATIRKESECSETSATLIPGKSKDKSALSTCQSQLKNANKFCMVSLLNFLTDTLPCTKTFHHLIKYIIRVKGSGKLRQKVDIFTLSHFRLLFLNLNDWNISQLSPCDINMHRMVFSEIPPKSAATSAASASSMPFTKEELEYMNGIKQQLLQLSISFFENSANIKQKIQSKPWQNEDTAKHYLEWVNRITKGIKKMASGVYIHRF